ncbi:hypothetical protein [Oxynema aestuarii]|nr:hypothetical protein [Oxynema aestuarii]
MTIDFDSQMAIAAGEPSRPLHSPNVVLSCVRLPGEIELTMFVP